MAVGDIFRATLVFDVDGVEVTTNLDYRQTEFVSNLPPAAQCVNMSVGVFNQFANGGPLTLGYVQDVLNTSTTFERVEAFIVQNPTAFGTSTNSPVTGLIIGQLCPLQTAPYISKRTGLRGRSFRGSNYLPPLTEGQQEGGLIESSVRTNILADMQEMLDFTTGAGDRYQLTVYSETLSIPAQNVYTDTLVTSFVLNQYLKTQRRRAKK